MTITFERVIPVGKRKTHFSNTSTIRSQLDLIRCHAFHHDWEEFINNAYRPRHTGHKRSERCSSCGTVVNMVISPISGVVFERHYDWPDAYREIGGLSRPTTKREWKVLYIAASREAKRLEDAGRSLDEMPRLRAVG